VVNFVDCQVEAMFICNQQFAKKHNLNPERQKKRAEQRKAAKAESVKLWYNKQLHIGLLGIKVFIQTIALQCLYIICTFFTT
jgi:hypothetical protein